MSVGNISQHHINAKYICSYIKTEINAQLT